MSVDPTRIVQTMAGSLVLLQALPATTSYEQKTSMLLGLLLVMYAEDADKMVERLHEENEAIRKIFRDAPAVIEDDELLARLEASDETGASLRVSVLQAENDQLRALLIDLHAAVEVLEGARAVGLESLIWQELRTSAERRALLSQPL